MRLCWWRKALAGLMMLGMPFFGSFVHAGEMANLVMLFSEGDARKNAGALPDPICKLVKDCTNVAGVFLQRLSEYRQRLLLVLANTTQEDCHACTSDVSLLAYEGSHEEWQPVWKHMNFTKWGDWGIVKPEEVRMLALPDGRQLLVLDGSSMNQGIIAWSVELHLLDKGNLTKLGHFFTGCDSFGYSGELWTLHKWRVRLQVAGNARKVKLRFHLRDELHGQDSVSTFVIGKRKLHAIGSTDKRLEGGSC